MIKLEGHPDNIIPAYYGGLNACYKEGSEYKFIKYPVNSNLKFIVLYPDFKLSTSLARSVLPKNLTYSDAIYNLSRIIHLPKAFNEGNIKLLKDVLKDKLHEQYRLKLIPEAENILDVVNSLNAIGVISGSGASLLIITDDLNILDDIKKLPLVGNWQYHICSHSNSKIIKKKVV